MKPSAILIGLVAGCATALLFAGVVLQSTLAVVLSLAAPLPIFIASLGWGSPIGFLAALAAGATLGILTSSPPSGLLLFVSLALPAAIVGHVAGLARPASETPTSGPVQQGSPGASQASRLDWYPISRILFAIAAVSGIVCLFVGWLVGYDGAAIGDELADALSAQMASDPAAQVQLQSFAHKLVRIIPFLQPAFLAVVLTLGLYISASIVRKSGRLARPRDDLPMAATLPRAALPVFAVGLAASFATGPIGNVGAVFAGAFGMAFTLAGLAAIHRMTRATRSRGLLLFAMYMAIAILAFPLVAATVLGLAETARRPTAPPAN